MRISHSKMHHQYNVVLFQSRDFSSSGEYLFSDSVLLFAEENLAPHLIEFDKLTALPFDFLSPPLATVLEGIPQPENKLLNLVDVRIDKISSDIAIFYTEDLFDKLSAEALKSALIDGGQFDVELENTLRYDRLVSDINSDTARYIQIAVSQEFLSQKSTVLSAHLQSRFNPSRYVDTQVAFFLIMTTLSGSSRR